MILVKVCLDFSFDEARSCSSVVPDLARWCCSCRYLKLVETGLKGSERRTKPTSQSRTDLNRTEGQASGTGFCEPSNVSSQKPVLLCEKSEGRCFDWHPSSKQQTPRTKNQNSSPTFKKDQQLDDSSTTLIIHYYSIAPTWHLHRNQKNNRSVPKRLP